MSSPTSPQLPSTSDEAGFFSHAELGGRPYINVDGPAGPEMALGLSHWPTGGTPDHLQADTSTEIALRYLDARPSGPPIDALTNDHFDEDGLFAAWVVLTRPGADAATRAVAAAHAGDFFTWDAPEAAQSALATMALAERSTTPLAAVMRALNSHRHGDPTGALYRAILPHAGRLLDDPGRYRSSWAAAWERVERDRRDIETGAVRIDDDVRNDVALVTTPRPLMPHALMPHLQSMRVLVVVPGGRVHLEHRYETWVTYTSRALPARVDLDGAAAELTRRDTTAGTWRFSGVDHPRARLEPLDGQGRPVASNLGAELIRDLIVEAS